MTWVRQFAPETKEQSKQYDWYFIKSWLRLAKIDLLFHPYDVAVHTSILCVWRFVYNEAAEVTVDGLLHDVDSSRYDQSIKAIEFAVELV